MSLSPSPYASLWGALAASDDAWLHFGEVALSRAALREQALAWAGAMRAVCPTPERIGVLLPNDARFPAAFFAAQALGAAAVPLAWPVVDGAPERVRAGLEPVLRRARLNLLVTTPEMREVDWGVPLVTAPGAPLDSACPVEDGGTAFIQFTSGSTGDPRGAVISQRAALHSARAMAEALRLSPRDVGVSWLPFFHDMGLVGVLLTSLVARFPVHVLRPGDFLMRPRRWLELVSATRATLTVGPDFAYVLATRRVDAAGLDLSSLRCVLSGSEPVHRATLDGFTAKFAPAGFDARAWLPVYGLAEATLGVCFSRRGFPISDLVVDGREVPSVGAALVGVEVKVVDRAGAEVPPGQQGELCVRGPVLMDGYFEHPEATRAALRDGWLHTGDLGVTREGAVWVTGREKELIIQQGRKFHPYDIERVVSGLVDATPNGVAAVARRDRDGHERLVVMVELRRQSSVPDVKVLRGEVLRTLGVRIDEVECVPAGTLPRTTSGKVKRYAVASREPRVLILGAGGFLGLNAVRAWLDAGVTPLCGRRPRGNVLGLRELGVPLVVTDFSSRDSLVAALSGAEVVIHAAAHYPRFSTLPELTLRQGLAELNQVLDAAARAGVRRLVFVSSTATIARRGDGQRSTEAQAFTEPPDYGTYHQLKWALEQRALAEDRLQVTIANPSACLGPHDWKVGTSALLLATARGLRPSYPAGLISTVDARDVAQGLRRLATMEAPPRRLILSGGEFDAHALMARLAQRYHAAPPLEPMRADEARALADAQERHALEHGGRATLARELVDLIVHSPALDAGLSRALGITYRPLSETLDAWDAWALRMGLLSPRTSGEAHG